MALSASSAPSGPAPTALSRGYPSTEVRDRGAQPREQEKKRKESERFAASRLAPGRVRSGRGGRAESWQIAVLCSPHSSADPTAVLCSPHSSSRTHRCSPTKRCLLNPWFYTINHSNVGDLWGVYGISMGYTWFCWAEPQSHPAPWGIQGVCVGCLWGIYGIHSFLWG